MNKELQSFYNFLDVLFHFLTVYHTRGNFEVIYHRPTAFVDALQNVLEAFRVVKNVQYCV